MMSETTNGPARTPREVLDSLSEDIGDLWGAFEYSELDKIDWGLVSAVTLTDRQLLHAIYWNLRTLQLIGLSQVKATGLVARVMIEAEERAAG